MIRLITGGLQVEKDEASAVSSDGVPCQLPGARINDEIALDANSGAWEAEDYRR